MLTNPVFEKIHTGYAPVRLLRLVFFQDAVNRGAGKPRDPRDLGNRFPGSTHFVDCRKLIVRDLPPPALFAAAPFLALKLLE